MESVELRTIYHCVVVLDQDVAASLERIEYHGSRITQLDLENWLIVLAPPLFTRRSVIFSEFEQMTEYRYRSGSFGYALDSFDICAICPLQ